MKTLFTSLFLAIALVAAPVVAETFARAPLQTVDANGIQIAWTELGNPQGEPLVMIMGLGGSHKVWGDKFPEGFAELGYRVVLFDNRDVGGSERFDDYGQPVLWWNFLRNKLGFGVATPYTLNDMADDTIALMDHLGIEKAHMMGASMGGMIAQTIAVRHPERTRSLISIMSTTGAPHLPPAGQEETDNIANVAESEGDRRQQLNAVGFFPKSIARQLMAIMDAGDRTEAVRAIKAPTLVVHGVDDKLIPIEHGEFTAETIKGSRFLAVDNMAHNIPDPVKPLVTAEIHKHIEALKAAE